MPRSEQQTVLQLAHQVVVPERRVLTGMRPSGELHLGHYAGALENWIKMDQADGTQCIFLIADLHALGDKDTDAVRKSINHVVLDWLSVGLDPERSWFSLESHVKETTQLNQILSTIIPKPWLDINPTLKTELRSLEERKVPITVGFYTYPVLQTADILLPRATVVPVGEDQDPHIEMTRKVARKFNGDYGRIFPIPDKMHTETPRLVGTDGQAKMGKSLGNCIYLSDDARTVHEKVMRMFSSPRSRITDPGDPDTNPVFMYLRAFDRDTQALAELEDRYRRGDKIGDKELKIRLAGVLNEFLDPIRMKRAQIEKRRNYVRDVMKYGTEQERILARQTIAAVEEAMGIRWF